MKALFLEKEALKRFFKSIDNPFEAITIKMNLMDALNELNLPSEKLLSIWEQEGFDPSLISPKRTSKILKEKKPRKPRKINIESRTFLVVDDEPIKILIGRAVKSEQERGSLVLKYQELTDQQQQAAKKLL